MAVQMLSGPRAGRTPTPFGSPVYSGPFDLNAPLASFGSQGALGGAGTVGAIGTGAVGNTNYGNVEAITQLINEINQNAQQKANAGRIPGGLALEGQSSANIGSALAGEVDPSTINLLGQQASERGVSTGSPLGASTNAAYLRALGLTSQQLMNTGQNWLSQATARNTAAPIYGAEHRFLTAEQEQQAQLAREQMANQLRIAQMHYANQGRGGGYGGGSRSAPVTAAPGPASNWLDRLIPAAPTTGWNLPPGYSSIPVGVGTPGVGGNYWPDQPGYGGEWDDYVIGIPGQSDSLDNQFDFNDYSDMVGGYA